MDGSVDGREDAYGEQSYYEGVDDSIQDDYHQNIEQRSPLREQDRFLPIANIAKESKECVQECVSEFISFITSEAAERCQHEKRKTVNGEDLLYAINNLGFDNYVDPLKKFLLKFREASKLDTSLLDESNMFNPSVNNAPMSAVILNIPSAPMTLQAANAGPTTLTARARPSGPIVSEEVAHSTDALSIVHQGQQQIILTAANPDGTKIDEDMKLPANTTILVPLSGHVALVNGSAANTVPVSTEPSTLTST